MDLGEQQGGPADELAARRRAAEGAWQAWGSDDWVGQVRTEVARSWDRSAAHVPRGIDVAPLLADDRAAERWRDSPLRAAVEQLSDELERVVGDGDMIAAVTGADGAILWTRGSRWMRDRAADVHFVPGGRWDEASMGTNALALALEQAAPAAVFSAEHWSPAVHDWVCYSAPITDRASGRLLGVLDLSTTWDRAHPLALSTASLLARNLSLLVPAGAGARDEPGLALRLLGGTSVQMDGREVGLPPRQVEILAVLALHPEGLSLDALHAALFEDLRVKPATVKAEVSHLRRRLGDIVGSRPYRLTVPVVADHVVVVEHVRAGRLGRAVEAWAGPLLPGSESPALRSHDHFVQEALRHAVLEAGDPDLLYALGGRLAWDLTLHERTLACLPDRDDRRAIVHARLAACRD